MNTWRDCEGQIVDGKFKLQRFLGAGVNSAVFSTPQGETGEAAIKLVMVSPDDAESQLALWQVTAKLPHASLLRAFDMGRARVHGNDVVYLVSEYAEENLSQILPQRPLNAEEARQMLKPVLDALAFLHAHGFVHGHIKPANVLAVSDQIKLSRDSICRMGEPTRHEGELSVYDAPEAASGRLSPAVDVWSVGVLLVEALTQRLPLWERKERGEPALPASVPEPFATILYHCLRRDPQLRWTVTELASHLDRTAPQPQKKAEIIQRFDARRYVIPAAAGVVLAAGLIALPHLFHRSPPVTPATTEVAQAAKNTSKARHNRKQESTDGVGEARPASVTGNVRTVSESSTGGEVLRQVLPQIPQSASNTIHGTVRVAVRLSVDNTGNVSAVGFDSRGPSKYFANQALQAARQWQFRTTNLKPATQWIVRFEFKRTGVRAFAHPAA